MVDVASVIVECGCAADGSLPPRQALPKMHQINADLCGAVAGGYVVVVVLFTVPGHSCPEPTSGWLLLLVGQSLGIVVDPANFLLYHVSLPPSLS